MLADPDQVQIKSGHLTLLTWEFLEKDLQPRGQWKLQEMAQQFRASKKSKLNDDHDLVNWVFKDRQKKEEESQYTWYPYAAKKEEKGSLALNLGVEKQAMVIIRRKLTPKAQRKADELERLAQAKKRAGGKDKAERKAVGKTGKEVAAKRAKEAKAKPNKVELIIAKKIEEINQLEKQNGRLKAQQTHSVQTAANNPKNDAFMMTQIETALGKGTEAAKKSNDQSVQQPEEDATKK